MPVIILCLEGRVMDKIRSNLCLMNFMIWWLNVTNMFESEKSESEVTQSCPTLCYTMDCSLPGSSVHGVFQARVLEWVAISFSQGSSQPRDQTQVSCAPQTLYHLSYQASCTCMDDYNFHYLIKYQ